MYYRKSVSENVIISAKISYNNVSKLIELLFGFGHFCTELFALNNNCRSDTQFRLSVSLRNILILIYDLGFFLRLIIFSQNETSL
jgi:hypothetical protein